MDLPDHGFAEGAGEDGFHVEDGHQLAVMELGDGGDVMMAAGGDVVRRADLVPLDTDDAIDLVHEEAQGALAVLGDHHRLAEGVAGRVDAHHLGQRQHRYHVATQGDEPLHADRHVGRLGYEGGAGYLPHLEDVDAEDLLGTEGE